MALPGAGCMAGMFSGTEAGAQHLGEVVVLTASQPAHMSRPVLRPGARATSASGMTMKGCSDSPARPCSPAVRATTSSGPAAQADAPELPRLLPGPRNGRAAQPVRGAQFVFPRPARRLRGR